MSVKERIREFVKFKKIPIRSFEASIGVSYGYVNSIRVSIQPDKISSIASFYPDLNIDWLLTGNGDMIKIGDINTSEGRSVTNAGQIGGSVVTGNNNSLSGKNSEIAILKEENKHLKGIIEEKERLLEEKERLIQVLLKRE